MKKVLITLTVVIGAVLIFTIGSIGTLRGKGSREERAERALKWISSELDLTEEQRSKLALINDEFTNLEKEMKKDREGLKEEFISMIASNELDQDRILGWIKEKQKQVDDSAPIIIAKLADFHKSLNPEQRKKLTDEIKNHSHEHKFERGFYHRGH